ncbi:hypothetical protein [Shewanella cyperi]|uniref:hypothetical protein n=1 Tax=Shewanella cyperi TaxID=2814292 RepID=UPI001A950601|nr:hypothetical protein [Shewanella cyperi]QSX41220.1 hypothetical protein JYB84_01955 [Shewanella cyperi]
MKHPILTVICLLGTLFVCTSLAANSPEAGSEHRGEKHLGTNRVWDEVHWGDEHRHRGHRHHRSGWRYGINLGWYWSNYPWRYDPWRSSWPYWENDLYIDPRVLTYPQPSEPLPSYPAPERRTLGPIERVEGRDSLPANARVRIVDGQPLYEWEGIYYRYDWVSEQYLPVPQEQP